MRGRARPPWLLIVCATVVVALGAAAGWYALRPAAPLLTWTASGEDRLVTDEYRTVDADSINSSPDNVWDVTSGALYVRDGTGWTGPTSAGQPIPGIGPSVGSAVFRMHSRRADLGDVATSVRLRALAQDEPTGGTAPDWDGVHVWVRHVSEQELYAVSVMRRDGQVAIKRKLPGGPSNGGTYATLATTERTMPLGRWQDVEVRVRDEGEQVRIALAIDGEPVLDALDHGQPGPGQSRARAITGSGSVGVRADATEVELAQVRVEPCSADLAEEC
ncbi:hypothetical protein GCM10027055_14140 [Janibacter alkaliphilus]